MREQLASILTEILERTITVEDIQDDTNLRYDLQLTSLNVMYFVLEIENIFGVEVIIEEIDLKTFFTYPTIKEYIERAQLEND
ncbi:acyl carrier protein [Kordia sp.]|uniref:acyl carrier protein n=1 Tax=Kordia sp. TaxID=1965332 RepID=UPI003B5A44CA